MKTLSAVVPSWNGAGLLLENLPAVIAAARAADAGAEVIVVDDGSDDGTAERVAAAFPDARLVRNPRRLGFPGAANAGARAARGDLLALLNSDARPRPDSLAIAARAFEAADVFAVRLAAPASEAEAEADALARVHYPGAIRRGLIRAPAAPLGVPAGATPPAAPSEALYADGGAAVLDRRRFLELGGFDVLFAPGYSEDVDLGLAAWRRGWRTRYEPRAVALHARGATMTRLLAPRELEVLAERNRYLLAWKHLDALDLLRHAAFLAARIARSLARGRATAPRALLAALVRLPQVRAARRRDAAVPGRVGARAALARFERRSPVR